MLLMSLVSLAGFMDYGMLKLALAPFFHTSTSYTEKEEQNTTLYQR